jgi:hypothetical protein
MLEVDSITGKERKEEKHGSLLAVKAYCMVFMVGELVVILSSERGP